MKHILTILLILAVLLSASSACFADVDLSGMSRDELILLKEQIERILWIDGDKAVFITEASELTNALYESALDFGNVLMLELSFAESLKKIGGTYTAEKGRESGIGNFEKKSEKTWDEIVENREKLLIAYRNFIKIEISQDMICTEIRDQVKKLFEAYNEIFYAADTPSIGALTAASKSLTAFNTMYNTLMDSYLQ